MRSRISQTIVLGAIILFGAGACTSERSEWQKVSKNPSVDGLSAFIEKYPDGDNASEAQELLIQTTAWEVARDSGEYFELRQFQRRYQDSRFADEATVALTHARERLVSDFEPTNLMILLGTQVEGRTDGQYYAQWRGPIRYSLGSNGGFTGMPTYVEPDPTVVPVAVAVLDAEGMQDFLEQGTAYIWLGGTELVEWRDVSRWTTWQSLGEALEMPPDTEYAPVPAQFLSDDLASRQEVSE